MSDLPVIRPCPFCGIAPKSFFTENGTIMGYPVLYANIQCDYCGIKMSEPVTDDKIRGTTTFENMECAMHEIIGRWNKREG